MRSDAARCPVCWAGFRDAPQCSRCGADLTPLMRTLARAWLARRAARQALSELHLERAARLTDLAQQLHATPAGRRLASLCAAFRRTEAPPPQHPADERLPCHGHDD